MRKIITGILFALSSVAPAAMAQLACPGDCDDNGSVGVSELIVGVNISLELLAVDECAAMDLDDSGTVSVGELITAVNSSLDGCPTPVPFADVQEIFTANCANFFCHGGDAPANNMSLEVGEAFDDIVDVVPLNPQAAADGLLRVDPGNPEKSFLLLKIADVPPALYGGRMPVGGVLPEEEIQLIEDWIAQGANP